MTKKAGPQKFEPNVYTRIILNDLIVYSLNYLHDQGREITSEDIIFACFTLFPKRFSLRKYPHWPDSAIVSRRWSDCRRRGYLLGDTAKGFKLTAKGFRHAEKVEKMLGGKGKHPVRSARAEIKTRAGRFVRFVEVSDAYAHYRKKSEVGEFDFRSLLLCTMESPPATLARNLEQFKEYVSVYNRKDLLAFLDFCEEKFSHLLGISKKLSTRKLSMKKVPGSRKQKEKGK